jgi:hypothetical protein
MGIMSNSALYAGYPPAGTNVYLYNFARPVLTDVLPSLGATHGAEIAFVFGSAEAPSPEDEAIGISMQGYWSRFAHTGDPNGEGALQWPVYDDATDRRINFDVENSVLTGFRREECELWWGFYDEGFGQTPPLPEVEGPLTGPGEIFIDPLELSLPASVADFGYGFEDYIVSGTAAGEPYSVRLLVARPVDPSAPPFSGHVIVEPKHPTSIPFVWYFTREYLMSRGHAAVEVSTFPSTVENWLRPANPGRYGGLHVTAEQESDILAQVGLLLKSDRTPLPGAAWLHMTGHSMSAGPTWRFMDTHHDAYRLPNGDPIYDGFFPETTRTASRFGPFPDVDVPTILINSELEVEVVLVEEGINYRKPDSDETGKRFRLYEVAGMPHNPAWKNPLLRVAGIEDSCDEPLNAFPYEPIISMALDHLVRWVGEGKVPPRAEPIALVGTPEEPIAVARDEHGNALGGLRTTTLDVPVAVHRATNTGQGIPGLGSCLVFGSQHNLSKDVLESLYGDHAGYVDRVNQRLDELIRDGWYLADFADEIRTAAEDFDGFE